MGGRPRDCYGLYTTCFALTPGNARYNDGFKLHGIKMPPTLFWGLVIGFPALPTLRAYYFISYKTEVNFYLWAETERLTLSTSQMAGNPSNC